MLLLFFGRYPLAEQQSHTPETGDTYDGVNYAADDRSLPTADISHQVELEKANQQPVDGADNSNDK